MDGTERTPGQIREHYEIERELADSLRRAGPEARTALYNDVYDELFRRVPNHPQLLVKMSPEVSRLRVEGQLKLLRRYMRQDQVALELGPGDCALSLALARHVAKVYAVDVSAEICKGLETPDNFEFVLSSGASVPVPAGSVDIAYSNQLMEHLHIDDALAQLRNIRAALAPGGKYVCITPSRLTGPHDVSKHFDDVATGLHLKEYTVGELTEMFTEAGFSRTRVVLGGQGYFVEAPGWTVSSLEALLDHLPRRVSKAVARSPLRMALAIRIVGFV